MKPNIELIDISTPNNEKFKCSIPIELSETEINEQNQVLFNTAIK
jgi:hypothetical protein